MPLTSSLHKQQYREIWGGDATFATTLLIMLVDTYGTEGMSWDADTIRAEIQDDFDLVLPRANLDRLMTAIAIITTDDFYNSLPDFVHFCNVLDGDLYDPTLWDPAEPEEIAWGITEALLLDPPTTDAPFNDEILAYIGKTLDDYGIMTPPDVLRIAARDQDPLPKVHAEFSDDVEMFQGIAGFEKQKTDEINAGVIERLKRLSAQLDGLPVRAGSTRGAVRRVLAALQSYEAQ